MKLKSENGNWKPIVDSKEVIIPTMEERNPACIYEFLDWNISQYL